LVPLSVFVPDVSPTRIADEIEALERAGEVARIEITKERELAMHFTCKVREEAIEVRIVLPHGYPSTPPRVYADLQEDVGVPHRWRDGALCLYGVLSGWNPGRHGALSTLTLTRQWLNRYVMWRDGAAWPGSGEAK
jgi:ubiquitin-protein ligase